MTPQSKPEERQLLDDMVDYYRQRAASYETIYYRDNIVRRQEIDDECRRVESYARGKRVIELACGTGYWTEVLSRSASKIIACDITTEMLAEAEKKNLKSPTEFFACDMFDLSNAYRMKHGTELERAELVVAGFWHSHQPRQLMQPWLDLLARLCRPDGLVWLIDNNPPAEGDGPSSHGVDSFGNNLKDRELPDGSIHRIVKNYFSRDEIEKQFTAAGEIQSLVYGQYYWSVLYRPR